MTGGMYHNIIEAEDGNIYIWGRGLYGVLGNGSNNYSLTPEKNIDIEEMREALGENNVIAKMDAADEYSAIKTTQGEIYVWGKNERGQMGLGSGIGIDMYESESQPTLLKFED